MVLETGEQKKRLKEKMWLLLKQKSLSFGPVPFEPPTVVEVDWFPSGSITLDKDTVGEHGQYLNPFTVLIYMNPAFDVNASPVVLIFNI